MASKMTSEVQWKLIVFAKAIRFYINVEKRATEYKILKLRYYHATKKLQQFLRRIQSKSSLERYRLVPPIFTRFLHRYKRRQALVVITSFINDVQRCRTKRIVRRFLMAVKKVQSTFFWFLYQFLLIGIKLFLLLVVLFFSLHETIFGSS